jgi:excisionase family DNA binding protein
MDQPQKALWGIQCEKSMVKSEKTANNITPAYPSVAALANDLGMCERSVRASLRRGEIPHIRLGKRFILPRAAIADWLRNAGRPVGSVVR